MLTVHGTDWIPPKCSDAYSEPQQTQKGATKLRLIRAYTTMCAQRQLDSAVLAASVSTLTRASYTAQFTPRMSQNISDLDVPLNKLFRRLSGNMNSFPSHLLYLATGNARWAKHHLSIDLSGEFWEAEPDWVKSPALAPPPAPLLGAAASGPWRAHPSPSYYKKEPSDLPLLAPYLTRQQGRRILLSLQALDLCTLGDLSYVPIDALRQSLPPKF